MKGVFSKKRLLVPPPNTWDMLKVLLLQVPVSLLPTEAKVPQP
jgi:hypothetical protein